ncbi:DUF3085 domain-containing protein [Chitinophaga cymbidii]|uniref:Uncharacterized protein n=1 Tax=Chitinophaga cymbidii TaxID=1096750 RepID=A0A512RFJ0_9BACT|nr:DUF3085 domain-containing protein [Chitinophaga cymbidii]GEP94479.1 hypothetical protein CCY01nite_07390 [Chitinophaga cymbidii]
MARLIFRNVRLKGLFKRTSKATTFRATFAEMVAAYERDTGKSYNLNYPNVDIKRYAEHSCPTIWLVKENNIYLMTSALIGRTPPHHHLICFADGFIPYDPDSWEKCRATFGEDYFIQSIPVNKELQQAIEEGADIHFDITPEIIEIIAVYSLEDE